MGSIPNVGALVAIALTFLFLTPALGQDLPKLHTAAQNGNLEEVEALIGSGGDVAAQTSDGVTALHMAAFNAETEGVVDALIGAGADVNAVSNVLGTPLHWALYLGNRRVADHLILGGADVARENSDGRFPFDVVCLCSLGTPLADLQGTIVECIDAECEIPKSVLIDPEIAAQVTSTKEPEVEIAGGEDDLEDL